MISSYFKIEEKLNDVSNFGPWKERVDITLEEHEVLEYVEDAIIDPPENASVVVKSEYKKGDIRTRKIILDSLSDHLITYVSSLKKTKEMYDKLTGMFAIINLNQIIALKNKLKDIKMSKGETVQAYYLKMTKIRNQLSTVGDVVPDKEMVLIACAWRLFFCLGDFYHHHQQYQHYSHI